MAAYKLLLVVFHACLLVASHEIADEKLVVSTTAGKIRGSARELNGVSYRVFAGVPYAEAPIAKLRFKSPVDKKPWGESVILNTTSYGPSCPQNAETVSDILPDFLVELSNPALEISEDCLSLNVYTPSPVNESSNLAVLVWLHGGSFREGKGSAYDVSPLAVQGGIIVVTINYRLGPLGFLFTGDDNAPGNMGLMDQQLALKWVRDNIRAFGGDPSRVTLAGQAGVHGSVSLHLFANDSRSLFHRIAAHSGVFRPSDFQSPQSAYLLSSDLADYADCPIDSDRTLVDCLREKTTEEIVLLSNLHSKEKDRSSFVWQPVFTPDFFIEESTDSKKYNLLSVVNSGDGTVAFQQLQDIFPKIKPEISSQLTQMEWEDWFNVYDDDSQILIKTVITHEYLKEDFEREIDENVARMLAFVNSQSDSRYQSYGKEALHAIKSSVASTHVMIFNHQSSRDARFRPELKLAPHGSELPYIFGIPFDEGKDLGDRFTDEEKRLSAQLMQLWSNFVKTGDPNGDAMDMNPLGDDLRWPEFDTDGKHLKIQWDEIEIGKEYRKEGVYIWGQYIPSLKCPATPTPAKIECKVPAIGKGLGLSMNNDQAEALIVGLIFISIAAMCIAVVILGVACGYRSKEREASKGYTALESAPGKNDYSTNVRKSSKTVEVEVSVSRASTSYSELPVQKSMNEQKHAETNVDTHMNPTSTHVYANVAYDHDIDEPNDDPEKEEEEEEQEEDEQEEEEEEQQEEDGDMVDDIPQPPLDAQNDVNDDDHLPPPPYLDEVYEDGSHGDE